MGEDRDITAGELLDLLSDDEMIEGGYDRGGMVALLLLARAALQVQAEELAELRRVVHELENTTYWLCGHWEGGGELDGITAYAEEGGGVPPVELRLDGTALAAEARRRQAREWCRSVSDGEGPALEQLLSLARHHRLDLIVTHDAAGGCEAGWWSDDAPGEAVASAKASGLTAAIRAATCELLGLDVSVDGVTPAEEPRQTCGSCQHWRRGDEPATEGGARPCGLDEEHDPAPRHPASLCARPGHFKAHPCASCDEIGDCGYPWNLFRCDTCEQQRPWCQGAADAYPETCDDCVAVLPLPEAKTDPAPDSDEQLPGVSRPATNLIRSEGGDDV